MSKQEKNIPIDKGQFTLESEERAIDFEVKRGFGNPKEYALYRVKWAENPRSQIVNDYPLHVDIELSSLCNLKCPMCYTITPEFAEKVNVTRMNFDLYKKIVDQCALGGVYSIRLSLRGESFLHKNILECVEYAKMKGIREVSTLTNGLKLNEGLFTKLMNAGIDWITISFDGLGEVYESIRYPAKYKRAVEKIQNYAKIKADAGRVKPVIKIQSVLPAIENNPNEFYEVFSPISDMVSANPLIDYVQSRKKLPKIENFSCPQLYQRLVIGADGLCMMCANDENGSVIVGDVNSQSIHEIWVGDELTKIRELHKQGMAVHELDACAECYLPIQTYESDVKVGDRTVSAEKYVLGNQKIYPIKVQTTENVKKIES